MGAGIRYFYRCDLSDQERKSTGSRLYAVGDHRAFRTGILAWSDGNPDFFGTVRMASVRRTGFLDRIHFTIVYNGMWNHGGSGEILPFFHVRDIERSLSSMLEVIRADYVRTARAKGQKEFLVMFLHAFRNSLIQVITILGLQIGGLLSGSVLTETVFSIPGMGRLLVDSIAFRDYPVIQGLLMLFAFQYVIINLIVDLLYGVINPKIRYD